MSGLASWLAGVLLLLPAAGSTPRMVLYEPDTSAQGLANAIRIQLAAVVELVPGPALNGASPADRIGIVRADLLLRSATLGAWIETSSAASGRRFAVYVVHADRPFVETASVAGAPGPDLERGAALKVLEIIAPIQVEAPPVAPAGSPSRFGFSLEAGTLGALGDGNGGVQGGLLGAIGGRFELDTFRLDVRTSVHVASALEVRDERRGSVRIHEWGWTIGLRAMMWLHFLWLGPALDASLRVLGAEGTTPLGSVGEATIVLPSLAVGAELRVPIWRLLEVRALIGAGLNAKRHQLALNDLPLLDVGRWYGNAHLSLVLSVP